MSEQSPNSDNLGISILYNRVSKVFDKHGADLTGENFSGIRSKIVALTDLMKNCNIKLNEGLSHFKKLDRYYNEVNVTEIVNEATSQLFLPDLLEIEKLHFLVDLSEIEDSCRNAAKKATNIIIDIKSTKNKKNITKNQLALVSDTIEVCNDFILESEDVIGDKLIKLSVLHQYSQNLSPLLRAYEESVLVLFEKLEHWNLLIEDEETYQLFLNNKASSLITDPQESLKSTYDEVQYELKSASSENEILSLIKPIFDRKILVYKQLNKLSPLKEDLHSMKTKIYGIVELLEEANMESNIELIPKLNNFKLTRIFVEEPKHILSN